MGLFSRQNLVEKEHHNIVTTAFTHVKRDVIHIFDWLKYFHTKHQEHDQRLAQIEQQLTYMPKSHNEIKQIIDYYYSTDHLQRKIDEINIRINEIENKKVETTRQPSLREKLVRKITKNSKDYVKSMILSLIKKYERISAPQLKEIVVEEQGICSKSSFYRILTEIEEEGDINSIQSGKEKIFLHRTAIIK